jgi:NAD(P)-dependent dehydrogenase (short-subunit alcohol dehydrogenase family)
MTRELEGKVALVTGAASGIGAATAAALAAAGAAVVAADVADEEGARVARELNATYARLDVTEESQWRDVAAQVEREHGGVDVLVNNAGIGSPGNVESQTIQEWERVIAVNQTGVFFGMNVVGPIIRRRGGGSIVNISSIFGTFGGFGASIAYSASKGAVRTMSKNAAIFWAPHGVRVNSVHPGFIDTPLSAPAFERGLMEHVLGSTPLGRLGLPEEVADAIVFLAGDRASFVTGSELYVDGGYGAR